MAKVIAVSKDTDGDILLYKLDDGRIVGFEECKELIHNGELPDLMCVLGRPASDGYQHEIIRSKPDGDVNNNLSNLPTF